MLGNIILILKKFIKQNLFCIHKYKRHSVGLGEHVWYECENCGKKAKGFEYWIDD